MQIEIEDNPNSGSWIQCVFVEIDNERPIRLIRARTPQGTEEICEVIGLESGWRPVPAFVCPVQDSSDGTAYLIRGGSWGIRLRPRKADPAPWAAEAPDQWGEPYKMYGSLSDVIE